MKTAREWFEELAEPYRSQAIENIDDNRKYNSLCSALRGEFTWFETTQGSEYWIDLFDRL